MKSSISVGDDAATSSTQSSRRYFRRIERPAGWWPWGWLPVAGLLATFIYGLLVTAPEIQAHTTTQVSQQLSEQGIDVLAIEGDGQRVRVRAAAIAGDEQRIRELAEAATCRTWFSDNAVCPNHIEVELVASPMPATAEAAQPSPAVETMRNAQPIVSPRPHRFTFAKADGRIVLDGEVPTEEIRRTIVTDAELLVPAVIDNLVVSGDEPTDTFDWAIDQALPVLQALDSGEVEWRASKLSVRGRAAAEEAQGIRSLLASRADMLVARIDIDTTLTADRCNAEFSALLDATTIRFATGSSTLLPANQVFLDRIAELAQRCAQPLVVGGHTDDRGAAEFNLDLSRARAQAVVAELIERGVPASQLNAQGFGHTRPIADNATPAGRAANRRIEILAMGTE